MNDEPAYLLEIETLRGAPAEVPTHQLGSNASSTDLSPRPWIGVTFECCGVYVRVYRDPKATAYKARCPRCHRQARVRVGPDGTASRFFTAH